MADWSDGYFKGVQYTNNVFTHLAPGHIAFACLRQGVRPPRLAPGAAYMELGCGQGFGLNLVAAANPAMRFLGVDFNPTHIANARRLAEDAGLDNVAFEDFSFEQVLAQPEGRIPKCDVIALHGVYSWISPEARGQIVRILDRFLKPGGLVSISYNTLPGWAQIKPLRDFVKAYVDRASGPAEVEVMAAFRAAQQMLADDHRYFAGAPQVRGVIEKALGGNPAYLIHEHLNAHLHPLYFAEVARELEEARLTYAAASSIEAEHLNLLVDDKVAATINAANDPIWRQTLLDYALDRRFRTDVFVRGHYALGPREALSLLGEFPFALVKPAGQAAFEFKVPRGKITGDPGVYGPIVGALAEGPLTYGEIAALPALTNVAPNQLLRAFGLLVSARLAHPAVPYEQDKRPAQAMNRVLLDSFLVGEASRHLASPVAGAAVSLEFAELLGLAVLEGASLDRPAAARRGWEVLSRTGVRLQKDGKALNGQAEHEAELDRRLAVFEAERLPGLRRLGVV